MKISDPLSELSEITVEKQSEKKNSGWFMVAMIAVGFCIGFTYQLVTMFAQYSDSMKTVRQKVTSANEYITKMTVDGTDTAVRFWKEVSDLRMASKQNEEVQQIIERNKKINERTVEMNRKLQEESDALRADNERMRLENEALSGVVADAKKEYENSKTNTDLLRSEKMGYFLQMEDVKRAMLEAMDRNTSTGKKLKAKYYERVSMMSSYYDISKQPGAVEAMSQLCDSIFPIPEERILKCNVTNINLKFQKLDMINFY